MKTKFFIFIGFIVIFIAGGAVVYFAMAPSSPIDRRIVKFTTQKSASPAQPALAAMNQSVVQPNEANEMIDLLRTNFLDAPSLVGQQMTPQNLNAILAKLGSQVRVSPMPVSSISSPLASKSEILLNDIGYWRIPSFSEKSIAALTDTWNAWQKNHLIGLIIDLRDFQAANDFAGAADFLGLFITPKTPLFAIQETSSSQKVFQSGRQPLSMRKNFPVIILTNENTRGAGEILAYVLQQRVNAITLGQPTAGEAAVYTETKLRSSGRFARRATQTVLTDKNENLLGKPLVPDIQINVDPQEESSALQQAYTKGAAEFIKELPSRKRLNEASLVKEEDVELNDVIEEQLHPEKEKAPQLKDITLQHATDVLRGIAIDLPESTSK